MTNMGRVEYSQGVRQAIQRLHLNESCTRITANGVTGGGTGGSGEGCFVLGGRFTLMSSVRPASAYARPVGDGDGAYPSRLSPNAFPSSYSQTSRSRLRIY